MVKSMTSDIEDQATTADLLERKVETHVLLRWQADLARRKNLSGREEERYQENATRIGENLRSFKTALSKKNYNTLLSTEFHLSQEAIANYEGSGCEC